MPQTDAQKRYNRKRTAAARLRRWADEIEQNPLTDDNMRRTLIVMAAEETDKFMKDYDMR